MATTRLAEFVSTLAQAVRLDITDLNYVYSSERLNALNLLPLFNFPHAGLAYRAGSFLRTLAATVREPSGHPGTAPPGTVLFFVVTKNQCDSLLPVCGKTVGGYFAGTNTIAPIRFPLRLAYLAAVPFLPLVLGWYFRSGTYVRRSFRYFLDEYWLIYGYYIAARAWLYALSPRGVVVANDHNYPNRVIVRAARDMHIPTFYIQHASVTEKFPALTMDYALLEGMDALEKYSQAGPTRTRVFLVGMAKADAHLPEVNTSKTVRSVGLCTNNLDSTERADVLCRQLAQSLPHLDFTIRPHPGDGARWAAWAGIASAHHMRLSDSRSEGAFAFLRSVDAVIVGDSSITLEAVLQNVYPLYYDLSGSSLDYYGFLRSGLTEACLTLYDVCDRLRALTEHKPPIRARAKKYCATLGTPHEGRTSDISAALIDQLAAGLPSEECWVRIQVPGTSVEAFVLPAGLDRDAIGRNEQDH